MSDEILKEFNSKIYFAVTKIRNDRKRAEINTIHKEVTKTPIFNDITKDLLQDRIDKLLKNGTLPNKPNRDKDSLRINRDKRSKYKYINPFHTLSTCSITHNISTIYTNTNSRNAKSFVASNTTIQFNFTNTQETAIFFT